MKKRILSIIIALLLLSIPAWANSIIFGKNRLLKVAGGTFTAANARVSYVNGTAFVCFDTDISAYAGTDAGSTPYMVVLQDASGDTAIGYCGANGSGETLSGSELVTNGTFNDNAVGWTLSGAGATIASSHPAGGGQSDDYAILTSPTNYANAYQFVTIGAGVLAYYSGYMKSGTAGNIPYVMGINALISGTSSASWVQKTQYLVGTSGEYVKMYFDSVGGTMLFDEISAKQVTDCAVTGLHVMSAKNGTVRNWYSISATFGYNDAMIYRIYRAY